MSFNNLRIRYQTARSLPAPYAYFYTLSAKPVGLNALSVDFAIAYPDRDEIDDDELIAEGFTRDDDFSWSGQLPRTWLDALAALVKKSRLQPLNEDTLDEDDDFWEITVDASSGNRQLGKPSDSNNWQYLLQELIQAIYERMGRERPFELIYLNLNGPHEQETRLVASFAERTIQLTHLNDQREQRKTVPWTALQQLMEQVYKHDYSSEEAQPKRPNRAGQWLNLGTDEWHEIGQFRGLTKQLNELVK